MAERWNMFVTITLDAAWLLEFFIVTLAWTIVCHGMKWPKEKIFIWLTQSILLYAFTAAADALMFVWIGWNSKLYSTLARGVICAVYIRTCSYYKPKTNVLIWCSMYAGVCALSVIAGQMSYLTGAYIGKGAVEGVARCVIYVLMIPLAVYLRRFNFDDYETIPFSGMALIITGDLSILALNVVETVWSGQDNRITIILACAFTVMMLMVIVARCIYVGTRSPDFLRKTLCFGVAAALVFQILINVGMCIGLLPIIGLTLPFISYGGSSIVSLYAMVGLVSGVYARPQRPVHERYIQPPIGMDIKQPRLRKRR